MSELLEFVVRPSLVLAAGLAAAWSFRKQPAALRHWLLAAAVGLAVVQPVMTRALPSLSVPVIDWRIQEVVPVPADVETSVTFASPEAAVLPSGPASSQWMQLLSWVWIAGALVSAGVLAAGALWMTWLGSRATVAGANWQATESRIRRQLGIRRPIRIAITRHPALLVTWGAVKPVILLPADADDWAADRIELVLAHEMAHLVRRDWLTQCFAELARAINWFNPLFWIACSRLRRESEYACDDVVLDLGIGGTSYASHLVDLARTFSVHGRTWLPAPSIARPSTLERRVRAMLNPQLDRRPVSRLRRGAVAAILIAIALPIAAASQQSGSPTGTLTDPSGKPLVNATLRLTAESGDQTAETRTDASGSFAFPQVPAGEYMLSVTSLRVLRDAPSHALERRRRHDQPAGTDRDTPGNGFGWRQRRRAGE